jgi:hypothetical protein
MAAPQAILVSDCLILKKIFSSETAWPNESELESETRIACGGHVC